MTDYLVKLNIILDDLPDVSIPFFTETGTELSVKTRYDYAYELSHFLDYMIENSPDFKDRKKREITEEDMKKITSQDISRYLTNYRDQGHSERSTAKKRASLSRFFSYLVTIRLLPYSPVDAAVSVKIHYNKTLIYLTPEEQNQLLNTIDYGTGMTDAMNEFREKNALRDKALVLLFLDTGIRVSELCGIRIGDINFDKASVHVLRKGGDSQDVYFSDEASEALQEYLEDKRLKDPTMAITDHVFTSFKGNLTPRGVEYMIKKYAMAALPGKGYEITPHKLRSSFAMAYYSATKDILSLQRKLNHQSIQTTTIYARASEKTMEETRGITSSLRNKE